MRCKFWKMRNSMKYNLYRAHTCFYNVFIRLNINNKSCEKNYRCVLTYCIFTYIILSFIFHRRQEIDGDNDVSLIHVAALTRNNACWRGRDLITDKRPPCYAAPVEAIRVPVRWILIRDGESNSWNRLRGKGRARMEEGEYNGIRETSEDEWQLDLGN